MDSSAALDVDYPRLFGIERKRLSTILALALPIIGGMESQNVLNLIDTLMVGRVGADALAAVGMGGFMVFLANAFVTGMATGVQAMVARRQGQGRTDETAVPLNGGLVLVVIITVPMSIALILLTPYIYPLLVKDPAVIAIGVPYVQVRLIAMIAVGANFSFRGYWNGISQSKMYLQTLLIMHACNVVISYILIFGKFGAPELGATGAGVGTTIATFIGSAYYFYLGRRYAHTAGFLRGIPSMRTMRTMLRLSIPSGVQTVFFAGGFVTLFSIIARVGTDELSAAAVLITIMLVAILPGLALGLSAASLVGQALGRGDKADAVRWGWDVVKVAAVMMGFFGLPMLLLPEQILNPFFKKEAPMVLAIAPLMLFGGTIVVDAMGMVLLNAMMGAGATRTAMVVSITMQWVLFLPIAYLIGPVLGYGLLGIWSAQIGYRSLQAVVLAALWKRGKWADVKV